MVNIHLDIMFAIVGNHDHLVQATLASHHPNSPILWDANARNVNGLAPSGTTTTLSMLSNVNLIMGGYALATIL